MAKSWTCSLSQTLGITHIDCLIQCVLKIGFVYLKVCSVLVLVLVRELLGTQKRRDEVYEYLKDAIGDSMMSYDIELVGSEITAHSPASSSFAETLFSSLGEHPSGLQTSSSVSIAVDNTLSRAHTLIQITCQEHKGLLYDIMRTFKDFNIQVCCRVNNLLRLCDINM